MQAKEARQYTRFIVGFGWMKPGVTIQQAHGDLDRASRRLGEIYPESDKGWSPSVQSYKESRVGSEKRALWLVFGAATMLLLILCANVAGLLLGRVQERERELAIRASLGASRWQIANVVLREVAILAGLSGALGLALAAFASEAMSRVFADLPRMEELRFDWQTALFTAVLTAFTALVFGLLPAMQATRKTLRSSIQEGGRSLTCGKRRLQQALVGSQFAVTLVLLAGAGLLLRSYHNLSVVESGFHSTDVITFHVGAGWGENREQIGVLQQRFLAELQRQPGVQSAGATNFLPASGATLREQVAVRGNSLITTGTRYVTNGYLQTLKIPLVQGALCPEFRLGEKIPTKLLVNQAFVRTAGLWNPIGQQLVWKSAGGGVSEIAGVVGDVREDALNSPAVPYVYQCLQPGAWPDPEYVVASTGGSGQAVSTIRRVAHRIAPDRAVFGAMPLSRFVEQTLDKPRLNAEMLTVFAMSALVSAALGLYGLVMLTVTARTKELGIRIALGAPSPRILSSAVAETVRPLLFALLAGWLLAYGALSAFRSLLFEIAPGDVLTFLGVCAVLLAVAATAAIVPGRRAVRIDPIEALRVE